MPQVGYSVRRLEPGDASVLSALRREALEKHPEAFSASIDDDRIVHEDGAAEILSRTDQCAVFGGFGAGHELVGMTGIIREPKFKHRHRMILWGMYVSPPFRGTGLASHLLEAAIGFARSCPEIEYVCLSATSSSEKALELYRRAGFLEWGREPCSFILGNLRLDGIHMMLSLRGSATGGSDDGGLGTAGSS